MLQQVRLIDGRDAVAIVLPDYQKVHEVASLKSALFLAVKNLATNPDFIASDDMVELLTLLENMDIDPTDR